MGHQEDHPPLCIHYDFKPMDSSCFLEKGMKDSLRQWGLEDTLTLTQARFCPAFMPHEETTFVRQFLAFAAERASSQRVIAASVESVQWEALKCTAVSMDFFDCLVEKGIVSQSGNIRGCFPDVFDGVTVSDRLRELLVNPDSENADVFSSDQQEELLFHIFRALSVGGGVCQPHDSLEPYTTAVKALYKDLVSVQKNASTGKLEIAACKVYRVTDATTGKNSSDKNYIQTGGSGSGHGADVGFSPKGKGAGSYLDPSPHSVCLVVVDASKKRASVLRKEFRSFW
ncbi:unnamed protein product [Scytosiphon promiscuus]